MLQQVFLTFINTLLSPIIMEKIKNPNKVKQGKKNRASGAQWERVVRADLEEKGWIVIKNPNNVINNKFTQGKAKYNPYTKRVMMMSGGFPDFIAFRRIDNVKDKI